MASIDWGSIGGAVFVYGVLAVGVLILLGLGNMR